MQKSALILTIVVAIAVLVAAGLFFFPSIRSKVPGFRTPGLNGLKQGAEQAQNIPQALAGEAESLDIGNLDAEFQGIDADLNKL